MKYYVIKLFERNGEYVYDNLFKIKTSEKVEEVVETILKTWYDSNDIEKESNGYYFNCGEVFVRLDSVYEVTEGHFNQINYLVEMI